MRVKICGITRLEDARFAEEAGADAIGVVVFSGGVSHRVVSIERAREIFNAIGPFTATVAVSHTRSEEDLAQMIALNPSAIQISHPFQFEEDPGVQVIRVIGRGDPLPEDCDAIIVDDSHGRGRVYDAGGLTPENVSEAVKKVRPYAVDVATGVETSPGIKDHEKIRAFIAASRRQ
jgi:phosphoribosylanthranilate isomerase